MKCISIILSLGYLLITQKVLGQHEMRMDSSKHEMPMDTAGHAMHMDSTMNTMPAQDTMESMMMSHQFSRTLPMTRNGSGTSWMPDATVMYGHGLHAKKWMYMMMANVFVRYNKQDLTNKGNRGGEKVDAPNWIMFMGQRNVGMRGLFSFNSMFSLDPITIGSEGYPLLFQTGETYQGKRLVDKQHPHDLITGLSIAYTHMFSKDADLTGYIGYPGEPALGPVTYMHRNTALNNPDAPLGHHWQDATHIVHGVATLGLRYKMFKLEGSSFNGREPDENRYNFEKPLFDSYSVRLLCNPTRQIAMQLSHGYLKAPERAEPGNNIRRTTASIIEQVPIGEENKYVANTFVWGMNSGALMQTSFLFESLLQWDRTAVYTRYEWLQKSADDLGLSQFNNGHKAVFPITAVTLGVSHVLLRKFGNNMAIGAQASLFDADARLDAIYGKNPLSAEIYLRFYPHLMHVHMVKH